MQFKFTPSKLLVLLLSAIITNPAYTQDIDRKKVDITYIHLPLHNLPDDVATYYVNIKSKNSSWGNTLGNIYEGENIKLNGYYHLPDATDADLVIKSETVNDLIFDKAEERRSELSYKRDKNSPEIKYVAYTYYVTYYTPKVHYRFTTKSGKNVADGFIGGVASSTEYGSTNYSNYFSNSYSLAAAWRNDKYGLMAGFERNGYTASLNNLRLITLTYCMYPTKVDYSVRYVDEKKGRTVYADLLQARDYYVEAVSTIRNDQINLINKLVQPDYQTRKETMKKAIDLWEKALAEADFDNKKARIDSKVGRHLYYNLALAYLWIDDFVKAKEYAQGRKKDLGSWDKNLLSGIRDLSALIDDRALQQDANKWRTTLLSDSNVYVYKDPATRQREKEEAAAQLALVQKQKADSLAKLKSKPAVAKAKTKPANNNKPNTTAKPANNSKNAVTKSTNN